MTVRPREEFSEQTSVDRLACQVELLASQIQELNDTRDVLEELTKEVSELNLHLRGFKGQQWYLPTR